MLGDSRRARSVGPLFGHPKGLFVLSATEMWERFSYYGMRSLLIFYLTQRLLLSDEKSFLLYGNYTALVFLSPLLGGWLADRYLGFYRAVVLGAMLMIIGHAGMVWHEMLLAAATNADAAVALVGHRSSMKILYGSLAFLIVGVGLLKPSVSGMVGELYPSDSPLRDAGFTIFVCGINIGAAVAALVCGYLGQTVGWAYGFGAAGVGVGLGLIIFVRGKSCLPDMSRSSAFPPGIKLVENRWQPLSATSIGIVLAITCGWLLMQTSHMLGYVLAISCVGAVLAVLARVRVIADSSVWQRLSAALLLMVVWIFSSALIEQEGSSINLFTDRFVDRKFDFGSLGAIAASLGLSSLASGLRGMNEIRSAQLQATTSILIIIGSPIFVWIWKHLAVRGINPSTPQKFSLSLLMLALAFSSLSVGATMPDAGGHVSIGWLFGMNLFIATACLLIIPVGLAAVSQLAAREVAGLMMGLWLLSNSFGNLLSSWVASFSIPSVGATALGGDSTALTAYQSFFGSLAISSALMGVIVLGLARRITVLMNGVH